MTTPIKQRYLRLYFDLINEGSPYALSRMALGLQGVGVVGLDGPSAATEFELIFSASDMDMGSDARDVAAGVNAYVPTPALVSLESEADALAFLRRLEDASGLEEVQRWQQQEDDEEFAIEDAVWTAMSEHPAALQLVRAELLREINKPHFGAEVEDILRDKIEYFADRRRNPSDFD
jgi:hypothetical protein